MFQELLPFLATAQGVLLVAFSAMWVRGRVRMRAATRQFRAATQEAEESAVRRLRLASQDLRSIGMTLHGNADDLHPNDIANAAADVFDMADDLHEFTLQENTDRTMREEEIHLAVAIEDAVATVNASIGPGRRQWRITPEIGATLLTADRRALRHVFTRALSSVVRQTGLHGSVEIGVQTRDDALAVVIENEHFSTKAPDAVALPNETRGFSLRLTLARSLMELHGGKLEMATRNDAGMSISMVFPAQRVCRSPVAASTPETTTDGKQRTQMAAAE